jgi:PTS system nitrogen regulatory IIA component
MAIMSTIILADLVAQERIVARLGAASKGRVVRALAHLVASDAGLGEQEIRDAVHVRGDLTTFGIGRGLALPHATVAGLRRPLAAFARLEKPVDFGALDGTPADLVMLILAPQAEDGMLLRALACAARRLREREVAEKLRGAANAEALHIVLTSDAWRAPEPVAGSKIAA